MMNTDYRKTTVRLSKDLVVAARRKGLDENRPMRQIVEEALEQYLRLKVVRKGGHQ
jgi:hypothetical protein